VERREATRNSEQGGDCVDREVHRKGEVRPLGLAQTRRG
jgi:hypothetical protein